MKKSLFLSLAAATALSAAEFGVELGYQDNGFDTDFSYGNENTRTEISEDDIGLDDSDATVKPKIFVRGGNHTLSFEYESLDYSGGKTITKDITFDDTTYNVGTRVDSTFTMDWYKLGYLYNLVETDNARFDLGLDLHAIETEVGLKADAAGLNENFSETIPLPTLVLNGEYQFNNIVGVEGKFSGISVGSSASYMEYYAGLNVACQLIENGTWRLGYQSKTLDADTDDFDGDMEMSGAYLGFRYNF